MNKYEKAIVFATIMCPFTSFRFGAIGIGEIVLVCLFVLNIHNTNIKSFNCIFSSFWIKYIICLLLGGIYHALFLDLKYVEFKSAVFDCSAYIMNFISCYTIELLYHRNKIKIYSILKYIYIYDSIILIILYFLSLKMNTIAGFPLRYFGYYAPFVNNLHQISMIIAPLVFVSFFIMSKEKNIYIKLYCIMASILLVRMTLETGSFKAFIGVLLGIILLVAFLFFKYIVKDLRKYIISISIFILSFVFLFNYNYIFGIFINMFNEEDINNGRYNIYTQAIEMILKSPVFGFGPGGHILNNNMFFDAHQSLLSILLQTGIIGLCVFGCFMFKYIKTIYSNYLLLISIIPIIIYLFGGDILRRLPIWILLLLFYYCEKINIVNNYGRTRNIR